MLRAILSVIAGYAAIFLVVMVTFSIAMFAIGIDRTYQPVPSWDVSMLWLVVSFVLGLIAAILGGWISALIAKTRTPPKVLAALVLVLGLLMALPALFAQPETPPPPRTVDVTIAEAMQYSKTPPVALILNPIIGCAGVLIGASLVKRKPGAAA